MPSHLCRDPETDEPCICETREECIRWKGECNVYKRELIRREKERND
jgi:hypothetical protein